MSGEETLYAGMVLADRFELVRPLGRGSIGIVWQAKDRGLNDDDVACKILRDDLKDRREMVADLKREVLLTRRLRHPNILAIYTFWDAMEASFVTMEYVDGYNLAQALEDRGAPFPLGEMLPWFRDLAGALDYAHAQGVLHRDVKPANMLLGENGCILLADFGIARLALDPPELESPEPTRGTIYFMSPEQLTGGARDPRSDLYSLAASLYQLLSGLPPFYEGKILAQIQIKPPAPLPNLSEQLNRELLKALSKQPQKRHASCGAFYTAFAAAAESDPASATMSAARPGIFNEDAPTVVLGDYSTGGRRTRLGRLLLERNIVSQEQLADALVEQEKTGDKLGTLLVKHGYLDWETLTGVLSEQLHVWRTRLTEDEIDSTVAVLLSRELAERHLAIPMRRSQFGILVAMADPLDMEALNELEHTFGESIDPLVATEEDIRSAIDHIYA